MNFNEGIVVISTVRNVEKSFQRDFRAIKKAFAGFENLRIIVVESDSTDNSRDLLLKCSVNESLEVFFLGNLESQYESRVARIAHCRNFALEKIFADTAFANIDYVVFADMDGRNRHLTKRAVASCWKNNNWDVCTANQIGPYYDLWALRAREWLETDCWNDYRKLLEVGAKPALALYKAILRNMKCLWPFGDYVEVQSAYGGLAIYKSLWVKTFRYPTDISKETEMCDHVYLNLEVSSKGGRIVINRKLINGFTVLSYLRLYISTLLKVLI